MEIDIYSNLQHTGHAAGGSKFDIVILLAMSIQYVPEHRPSSYSNETPRVRYILGNAFETAYCFRLFGFYSRFCLA